MSKSPRPLAPGRAMFSKSTSTARELSCSAKGPPEVCVGPPERRRVMRRDAVSRAYAGRRRWYQSCRGTPPRAAQRRRSSLESAEDDIGTRAGAPTASREASVMTTQQPTATTDVANGSGAETLTVTDNRTGASYELPIADGTIRATDLRQIKVDDDDFGLMTYDPAFMNTASCRSAITFLDGDAGHPALPRLPHRAARREELVPRGRLPAGPRRAADPGRSSTRGCTTSRITRSSTRT